MSRGDYRLDYPVDTVGDTWYQRFTRLTTERIHMVPASPHSRQTVNGGFTLIEILVVIVIVGLLASIVAPNIMGKIGGAKSKTARIQVEDLSAAVDLYFLDVGNYPSTDQGLDALITAPEGIDRWDGPYLRKRKIPADPWGHPYQYRSPGEQAAFELWSFGADGNAGGTGEDADVANWE